MLVGTIILSYASFLKENELFVCLYGIVLFVPICINLVLFCGNVSLHKRIDLLFSFHLTIMHWKISCKIFNINFDEKFRQLKAHSGWSSLFL